MLIIPDFPYIWIPPKQLPKFYPLVEQAIDSELERIPRITDKQMQYKQILDQYSQEEGVLVLERKKLQPRIKLSQMPEETRYNKLKTETRYL